MNRFLRFLPYLFAFIIACFGLMLSAAAERQSLTANSQRTLTSLEPQRLGTVTAELVQANPQDPELSQKLRSFDRLRLDPGSAANQLRSTGRLRLRTSRGDVQIEVAPYDLRAPGYISQWIDSEGKAHQLPKLPLQTYKGTVSGVATGQARLTIKEDSVEGTIITGKERLFLQPASSLSDKAAKDEFVFYSAADVVPGEGSCGVTLADEIAAEETRTSTKLMNTADLISPVSPLRRVRLATDADAEYVNALGGAAAASNHIMNIMNQVDGVYQVEMGIGFEVVFQNAFTDMATQPYTSTDASMLLTQFRTSNTLGGVNRSLAHLWTGKELDGFTIGIAYLSVVCQSSTFSYGLSQRFPTSSNSITIQTINLTSHEIGHNFAARHTNTATSEVPREMERSCVQTIMEGNIGPGGSFCQYSRSQIIGFATANSSCLTNTGAPPPPAPACSETSLSATTQSIGGNLSNTDCRSPSRGVRFFADRYSFNAVAGQQVRITMNRTGTTLDPYLYLIGPDGFVMVQDDDGNGGVNSSIGGSNPVTLSQTGKYIIEATSFFAEETDGYSLGLTFGTCTMAVSPTSVQISAAGGTGGISVTGNCPSYDFTSYAHTSSWLVHQITGGSGNQTLNYTVSPNSNSAGRVGFLIVGGVGNFGGLRVPVHQSGTGPDCTATPISGGQTVNGTLTTSNCQSPIRGNNFYAARHSFAGVFGQEISISLTATFDAFLTLIGPDGAVLLNDDDSGGGTNSRIPGGTSTLRLGVAGTYTIEVTAFTSGATGTYNLTLNSTAGPTSTSQFSAGTYDVNENGASVNLTITRSGDTTTSASLEYATAAPNYVPCNVNNGVAAQNCDYAVGAGTVNFAAGETQKTIAILINDDLYDEGDESISVMLSNPVGTSLGTNNATVRIIDNDTGAPTTNNIDDAQTFVRQAYTDFLSRLPDPGGLAFWTNEITSCGSDALCIHNRRITVSNAFFFEQEYQRTGSYVFRLYRAAYGNNQPSPNPDPLNPTEAQKIPSYAAFVPDRARIVEGVNIADSQLALANLMVNRPEFIARYPLSMNGSQFVTAILNTILATGSNLTSQQTALENVFNQGGRGAVLYRLADDSLTNPINNAVFIDNEYNRSFVFTEYAGYLRRDSDIAGFLFWLGQVNSFPLRSTFIQHAMVCSFITSTEYQQRFSPVVTRSNASCPQ
ncbi:MAG TPA: M12 family metallo-peptidase, partial [Pyrinomonadaceae bacterium]|nr:M12 family metallo-peptidase [Pyrinomonadaceae bacterium]